MIISENIYFYIELILNFPYKIIKKLTSFNFFGFLIKNGGFSRIRTDVNFRLLIAGQALYQLSYEPVFYIVNYKELGKSFVDNYLVLLRFIDLLISSFLDLNCIINIISNNN